MTLGNYNLNTFWLHISRHQNHLNKLIVVLLSVYLLAFAAELTWRLLPSPDVGNQNVSVSNTPTSNRSANNSRVNIQQLANLKLFGDPVAKAAPVIETRIEDAPETRLNLILAAVVTSSTAEDSAAIIANQGTQNTYGIGDKIDGTNATIQEVRMDRLIIKNGAKHETLMLEGFDFSQDQSASPAPRQASRANQPLRINTSKPAQLPEKVLEASRNLRYGPSNFTDYISIAPVRDGQGLKGYRVSPGKKPELFNAAGLVAGDILVDINGLDLTDPKQSIQALTALRESEALQMTVEREGQLESIFIELPSTEETEL